MKENHLHFPQSILIIENFRNIAYNVAVAMIKYKKCARLVFVFVDLLVLQIARID